MRTLRVTEEIRTDSETEAKELMNTLRQKGADEGYSIGACGYTYKKKMAKGEIIDEAWVVKAVKVFSEIWEAV